MAGSDVKEINRQAIETLIRQLAENGRGTTALGEAARWGRLDLLEELLADGMAVDARTESGCTPLILAASGGQVEVVRSLLQRGADVNAIAEGSGCTPLIACLSARHSKRVYRTLCKLLLDAGAAATLSVRDRNGRTALDWARDGRPLEVSKLVEEASPSP